MKVKKITTKSIDFDAVGATLLTVEEAKQLPDEVLNAVHDSWWLRSPGRYVKYAACVFGVNGRVFDFGDFVYKELGVRPVIIFKSSDLEVGDKFIAFGYKWTVVFPNKALCNDIIRYSAFHKDCQASDANVYEKSDIKEYVDCWFAHNCCDSEEKAYEE